MTMTQKKYSLDICKHNSIESNGMIVCNICGLVIDKIYYEQGIYDGDGHLVSHSIHEKNIGDRARTYIGYPSRNPHTQSMKNAILVGDCSKAKYIKRLTYRNMTSKGKEAENKYNMIVSRLGLSELIKNDIIFLYRKILEKANVNNRMTLLGACIYSTCKIYNLGYVTLQNICDAFRVVGSRMNKHLIIKGYLKYNEYMPNIKLSYNKYINYIINKITTQQEFEDRLMNKGYDVPKNIIINELRKYTYQIYERYPKDLRQGMNTYNFSASIIYAASKIVAFKRRGKSILTQEQMARATGISSYSIRDVYVKHLKPILIRDGIV